jgi:hypothetical protein
MPNATPPSTPPASNDVELESALVNVEQRLTALANALQERDVLAIEQQADELHRGLTLAVQRFGIAARRGGVPPDLRKRLAVASGQVAAQRESLARATAALDRAIDVLLPGVSAASASIYSASGSGLGGHVSGVIQA